MGLVSGIVVFIIIWWLVFFMVLPWGNTPSATPDEGHMDGAPEQPRIWLKMVITTGLASFLFILYYFIQESGWISFRPAEDS